MTQAARSIPEIRPYCDTRNLSVIPEHGHGRQTVTDGHGVLVQTVSTRRGLVGLDLQVTHFDAFGFKKLNHAFAVVDSVFARSLAKVLLSIADQAEAGSAVDPSGCDQARAALDALPDCVAAAMLSEVVS